MTSDREINREKRRQECRSPGILYVYQGSRQNHEMRRSVLRIENRELMKGTMSSKLPTHLGCNNTVANVFIAINTLATCFRYFIVQRGINHQTGTSFDAIPFRDTMIWKKWAHDASEFSVSFNTAIYRSLKIGRGNSRLVYPTGISGAFDRHLPSSPLLPEITFLTPRFLDES